MGRDHSCSQLSVESQEAYLRVGWGGTCRSTGPSQYGYSRSWSRRGNQSSNVCMVWPFGGNRRGGLKVESSWRLADSRGIRSIDKLTCHLSNLNYRHRCKEMRIVRRNGTRYSHSSPSCQQRIIRFYRTTNPSLSFMYQICISTN